MSRARATGDRIASVAQMHSTSPRDRILGRCVADRWSRAEKTNDVGSPGNLSLPGRGDPARRIAPSEFTISAAPERTFRVFFPSALGSAGHCHCQVPPESDLLVPPEGEYNYRSAIRTKSARRRADCEIARWAIAHS